MIALISGNLARKSTEYLVIVAGGVGYRVFTSLATFSLLPEEGKEATLHIHTHVREDQFHLFGFATHDEKRLFERLITISNIGPKLAMSILSGMEHSELIHTIMNEDMVRLSSIPGIGKKTAERIVLELKDKLKKEIPLGDVSLKQSTPNNINDTLSALVNLGYSRQQAEAAVAKIKTNTKGSLNDLIKQALQVIK